MNNGKARPDETAGGWRTASASVNNGACVEVGGWRKSGYSTNDGECVEAGQAAGDVAVRDSRLGDGSPVLAFAPGAWRKFTAAVRAGRQPS